MLGFEYIYTSPADIMQRIYAMSEYSPVSYGVIVFLCIVFIGNVYYVFPYLNILKTYLLKEREKRKRKNLIKQISMQKDIESEIESEINV